MKKVTFQEFIALVMSIVRGVTFISFDSETVPKLKKGNPWGGNVTKTSKVNGVLGYHYDKAVNRQRIREGKQADFEAAPRAWGEWLIWQGKAVPHFITHKGLTYLRVKIERVLESPVYRDQQGEIIPNESVKPWLYASSGTRQGVDDEIIHREYKLTNIKNIRLAHEEYELVSQ